MGKREWIAPAKPSGASFSGEMGLLPGSKNRPPNGLLRERRLIEGEGRRRTKSFGTGHSGERCEKK